MRPSRNLAEIFKEVLERRRRQGSIHRTAGCGKNFPSSSAKTPKPKLRLHPQQSGLRATVLNDLAKSDSARRKQVEGGRKRAVRGHADRQGYGTVYPTLIKIHSNQDIFSYGISDSPGEIYLYPVGKKDGRVVTGKPVNTQLPPPFDQVRNIGGVGHQVHHKFVVCGFNGTDPVVYCGSSGPRRRRGGKQRRQPWPFMTAMWPRRSRLKRSRSLTTSISLIGSPKVRRRKRARRHHLLQSSRPPSLPAGFFRQLTNGLSRTSTQKISTALTGSSSASLSLRSHFNVPADACCAAFQSPAHPIACSMVN